MDATKPLSFEITKKCCQLAKRRDSQGCVIAQALHASIGDLCEGIFVGSNIIKIVTSDRIVRYTTPYKIRKQIPDFDKTGEWNLPLGQYTLQPVPLSRRLGSHKRWDKWRKTKKKKNQPRKGGLFQPRTLATRQMTRIEALAKEA